MSDAAIANIVTGLVTITTIVVGFLTMWVKLKHGAAMAEEAAVKAKVVENKIDANTVLTAKTTAAAVDAAKDAKIAAQDLSKQMNGALDDRINRIVQQHVAPLLKAFKEHNDQDDRNMASIMRAINELKKP